MEKKSEEKRLRTTGKKIKNNLQEEESGFREAVIPDEQENQMVENRLFWGWQCVDDVAKEVWCSVHSSLLKGDLVFAYKSPRKQDTLKQIVIVRNFEMVEPPALSMEPQKMYTSYGVGYITSGYSALLPNVPYEYISGEIVDYLKDWKIDKTIINTYEAIVEELGKEELTNNGK